MDRRLAPHKRRVRRRDLRRTKPGTLAQAPHPHQDRSLGCERAGLGGDRSGLALGRSARRRVPALAESDRHPHDLGRDARRAGQEASARPRGARRDPHGRCPSACSGIDSDNGSEFINAHLFRYCQAQGIQFTRGRPYKKDDNAHIEQKNWTHVRKLLGWQRYDSRCRSRRHQRALRGRAAPASESLPALGQAHREEARRLAPRAPLRRPATPLDRLLACPAIDKATVATWVVRRDQLDPFALSQAIDRKIERLLTLATTPRTRPVPPTASASGGPPPRVVRRRPPPPRHLKTPFTFGNRLRRPLGPSSRVTS